MHFDLTPAYVRSFIGTNTCHNTNPVQTVKQRTSWSDHKPGNKMGSEGFLAACDWACPRILIPPGTAQLQSHTMYVHQRYWLNAADCSLPNEPYNCLNQSNQSDSYSPQHRKGFTPCVLIAIIEFKHNYGYEWDNGWSHNVHKQWELQVCKDNKNVRKILTIEYRYINSMHSNCTL